MNLFTLIIFLLLSLCRADDIYETLTINNTLLEIYRDGKINISASYGSLQLKIQSLTEKDSLGQIVDTIWFPEAPQNIQTWSDLSFMYYKWTLLLPNNGTFIFTINVYLEALTTPFGSQMAFFDSNERQTYVNISSAAVGLSFKIQKWPFQSKNHTLWINLDITNSCQETEMFSNPTYDRVEAKCSEWVVQEIRSNTIWVDGVIRDLTGPRIFPAFENSAEWIADIFWIEHTDSKDWTIVIVSGVLIGLVLLSSCLAVIYLISKRCRSRKITFGITSTLFDSPSSSSTEMNSFP